MSVTREEVEHIAGLARLALSEEEKALYQEQLSKILQYIEQLRELDTSDVPPTSHVVPLKNVFREDEPGESLPVEEALANAPDRWKNFYRVPKIIE
ncbi:MAG: Asp-tRNA(Asn)/Glu-tRNA(Gln) amidotransferase subunit GatC [Nitrospirae bacterium]|nr:MAG: Asp-tRNA(Asn)/Glu-tRNA(Gln) amidotransferase subunit GatC [Nitrospirota bacterium]